MFLLRFTIASKFRSKKALRRVGRTVPFRQQACVSMLLRRRMSRASNTQGLVDHIFLAELSRSELRGTA